MFRHFFRLQWKSFFRSSSFGKGIALKILMIFFAVYMLAALVLTGAGIYFILKKLNPDQSPIWTLSQYTGC